MYEAQFLPLMHAIWNIVRHKRKFYAAGNIPKKNWKKVG